MTHVTRNLGAVGIASPPSQRGAIAARSATRSQIQARYLAARDRHRHGLGLRPILIGALAIATVATIAFLFLRGGNDAAAAGDFATTHDRVVADVHNVPVAAGKVQRQLQLDEFNHAINGLLNDMGLQRDVFRTIARDAHGTSRVAALRAVRATVTAIDATDDFRRAIAFSRKLTNAQIARRRLHAAVSELDAAARAWAKA